LLAAYPEARFVLMHIGYPYSGEMVALAKHYPNAFVDLCWAWSVDPYRAVDFVRSLIHAAPINKLFAFGGDTHWPSAALAYAWQARSWLARALSAEVSEGLLSEVQAIGVAEAVMFRNQQACFDLAGTRAAIRAAVAGG
jgi:predicted TIM-barrel fold metal-dependent hydrolase